MSKFIVGFHAIEAFLTRGIPGMVLFLNRKNNRTLSLEKLALSCRVEVRWIQGPFPFSFPGVEDSRGAVLRMPQSIKSEVSLEQLVETSGDNSCLLMLDGITDVHNLGAIVRSADLFAVDGIILPKRRSAKDSKVVAQISAGASAYVPILETPNLVREISFLKNAGYWIYGADMGGTSVTQMNLSGRIVLVLGSEGKGLSRLVRESCDALVRIPMRGHVGSFNASVAAGILLFEIRRQQDIYNRDF